MKSSYLLQCDCNILQATVQMNVFILPYVFWGESPFLLIYKTKWVSVWNCPSCGIATAVCCTEFVMDISYVDWLPYKGSSSIEANETVSFTAGWRNMRPVVCVCVWIELRKGDEKRMHTGRTEMNWSKRHRAVTVTQLHAWRTKTRPSRIEMEMG